MTNYLNLSEATEFTIKVGKDKAGYPLFKSLLLGIMGGAFVAFGCIGSIMAAATMGPYGKFVGAFLFPVGLMFVILIGGALFTGNSLLGLAWFTKEITFKDYMKDLGIVWIGNLMGSFLIAFLAVNGDVFNDASIATLTKVVQHKAHIPFGQQIASGFLCNVLVAASVWMTYVSKDVVGKILACWFPVMLFAFLGFQHVVANMTYFNMAMLLDPSIVSLKEVFINSHIPVSIGNFISGGLFLPIVYGTIYMKTKDKH